MMDFERIKAFLVACSQLPNDPHNSYELVIYSDGSGYVARKNTDETCFTFASDESLEDKFKVFLKTLLE